MKKFFMALMTTLFLFSSSAFAADAKTLLNSASLTPTPTGFKPCDEIVQETLSKIINEQMTTYDKVKACYDWVIGYCEYYSKDNYHKVSGRSNKYVYRNGTLIESPYGISREEMAKFKGAERAYLMLKDGVGVCTDYSCAFSALIRAIGLNCYTISGQTALASGNGMTGHTWTVVKINDTEYVFDPQIDDNIAKGGAIGYYRFCKTYEETPDSYANYHSDDYFKSFNRGDKN